MGAYQAVNGATHLPVHEGQHTGHFQLLIGPHAAPAGDSLRPYLKRRARLKRLSPSIFSIFVRLTRPTHGARLSLTQQRNKISPALGERNVQQTGDDLEAGGQLQVRKILRDSLGNLDCTKVLQAEVLSNDKDLLPVLVWSQDLGALPDDKYAKIGVK